MILSVQEVRDQGVSEKNMIKRSLAYACLVSL